MMAAATFAGRWSRELRDSVERRWLRRCIAAGASIGLGLAGSPATSMAAPPRPVSSASTGEAPTVAVLPVAVPESVSDNDRALLTEALVAGLQRGRLIVLEPARVLAEMPNAASECDRRCRRRLADRLDVEYIVRAEVAVQDRDYDVRVELFEGGADEALVSNGDSCEICGVADAVDLIATNSATLTTKLEALATGPAQIVLVSDPLGADVTIDGEFVGRTPLERRLVSGERVVRISKDGYITLERELTVVDGVQERHSFELEKVPMRLPARQWGWVLVALGGASVATSIGFAVMDGRPYRVGSACDGTNVDPHGDCRRLWDTQYIALGTALAGAALVTLGGVIVGTRKGGPRAGRAAPGGSARERAAVRVGPGALVVRF